MKGWNWKKIVRFGFFARIGSELGEAAYNIGIWLAIGLAKALGAALVVYVLYWAFVVNG